MAYDRAFLGEILAILRNEQEGDGAAPAPAISAEEATEPDEPDLDDRFAEPVSLEALFKNHGRDGAGGPPGSPALSSLLPGAATDADTFATFIGRLGLRNFRAEELLVLGGNNASGPCRGRNYIPAKSLWPRIAPTIAALDTIRDALGYPIHITNAYRSPEYNACLGTISDGVAQFSQHIQFRAIDFKGGRGSPADWYAAVTRFRDDNPAFGIWTKRYNTFVHIDTRGAR